MKRFLSIILIIFTLISFSTAAFAEVLKNETVYVNLTYDGKTENIVVVNHISGDSNKDTFIDYGKYDTLEVLVNNVDPVIEGNQIKWPTEILKSQDIYYEGTIKKDLPFKLDIKYFLDNKEIKAEELAGKSGKLKILISIKDSPDLTTQIQIPMDLNIFSNIKAPSGVSSLVGKTMTVVFNHLPIGDQEFVLEAYGENIELDSILLASTASSIDLPDNIRDGIDQLTSGIDEMSDATHKLHDGSLEINKGTNALVDGLKSLSSGIAKLFSGSKEIDKNSGLIKKGFSDFNLGLLELKDNLIGLISIVKDFNAGLTTLNNESKKIEMGLSGLNAGATELGQGIDGLSNGLTQLNTGHGQLTELAKSLANSSDPMVKALAEGVIQESVAISGLSQGAKQTSIGFKTFAENTNQLALGYGEFNKGLNTAATGFNQMAEQLNPLPEEMDKMINGHTQLTEGLTPLFAGVNALSGGLSEMNDSTKQMPSDVQKLADGQKEISDGLLKLNNEGFNKIKSSMDELATLDSKTDEETYTSFVDNKNNKNSTVQFLMKTPSIKLDAKDTNTDFLPEKVKKTIFQRFLDLFRKK